MERRRRLSIYCCIIGLTILIFGINGCSLLTLSRNLTLKQKKLEDQRKLNEWHRMESPLSCEENFKEQLRVPGLYRRFSDFKSFKDNGIKKVLTWSYIEYDGNIYAGGCVVTKEKGIESISQVSRPYYKLVIMNAPFFLGCVDERSKNVVDCSVPR